MRNGKPALSPVGSKGWAHCFLLLRPPPGPQEYWDPCCQHAIYSDLCPWDAQTGLPGPGSMSGLLAWGGVPGSWEIMEE